MDHNAASDPIDVVAGRLDVVSDAICPWCWIGKHQLERALALVAPEDLRFTVHWRAFQLNPGLPSEGVDRLAHRAMKFGSPERAAERDAEVAAAGARVGLSFRHDLITRTPNTLAATVPCRVEPKKALFCDSAPPTVALMPDSGPQ